MAMMTTIKCLLYYAEKCWAPMPLSFDQTDLEGTVHHVSASLLSMSRSFLGSKRATGPYSLFAGRKLMSLFFVVFFASLSDL